MTSQNTKKPDYILVVRSENLPLLDIYFENLKALGVTFQNVPGVSIERIFVKVFISDYALLHFSKIYEIGNRYTSVPPLFHNKPVFTSPFITPLDETDPLQKGELTEAERIITINKVLENTKYGDKEKEFGLTKLTNLKYIETSYPLHDGPILEDGNNYRSLLSRYWSNAIVTHMRQPLDIIYRYFGSEVAFYFAWLEYFNIMLAIPAVLGAVTFLASLVLLVFGDPIQVKEVCESQLTTCPTCEGSQGCGFKNMYRYCSLAQWTFVFDNSLTVVYAIFMSFWATLFMTLWRRIEHKLKYRWNCIRDVRELELRQAYLEKTNTRKVNRITGEIEPYTSKIQSFFQYTVTVSACVFLFGILLALVIGNMIIKVLFNQACDASNNVYLKSHSKLLAMTLGAINTTIYMKLFKVIFKPASLKLTQIENPRTQYDFDNSLLYKSYIIAFMNCYVPQFYLALFKGQFVTVPHNMTALKKDACQPCSCILALCIQLAFLMTLKSLAGNIWTLLKLALRRAWKIFVCKKKPFTSNVGNLPQWEEEYYLEPFTRNSVTEEFIEMVLRYGEIIFFSKALPLAATCVLLNNLIELRSDAYKFVQSHRRIVPMDKAGIGAWNGILRSLSYISTALNAFIIAFTSDWVPREIYRQSHGNSLVGFINSTLSRYNTTDYWAYNTLQNKVQFCYYRGNYYPPENIMKYQRTQQYWINFTFKMITVFVFEHVVLLCNCIFVYFIPYKPESVRMYIDLLRHNQKEKHVKECEDKLQSTSSSQLRLTQVSTAKTMNLCPRAFNYFYGPFLKTTGGIVTKKPVVIDNG